MDEESSFCAVLHWWAIRDGRVHGVMWSCVLFCMFFIWHLKGSSFWSKQLNTIWCYEWRIGPSKCRGNVPKAKTKIILWIFETALAQCVCSAGSYMSRTRLNMPHFKLLKGARVWSDCWSNVSNLHPSDTGFLHRPYSHPNFLKGCVDYLRRTLGLGSCLCLTGI